MMSKITVREVVKEDMEDINLDHVPVSELTIAGQTWSSDDRQFFKRALDYNNEKVKKYIKKHVTDEAERTTKELAEALLSRDKVMFQKMDEQTDLMKAIQFDIIHLKEDVTAIRQQAKIMSDKYDILHGIVESIDKRTKLPLVYLRLAITAVVTAISLYFIIRWAHEHQWTSGLISLIRDV